MPKTRLTLAIISALLLMAGCKGESASETYDDLVRAGDICLENGQDEKAEYFFRKAREVKKSKDPRHPLEKEVEAKLEDIKNYDKLITAAVTALRKQRYAAAEKALLAAVALNKDDHRAYHYLGLNAVGLMSASQDQDEKLEKCKEGVKFFTQSLERRKDYPGSRAMRGICYELLGEDEKALDDYANYLELTDENDNSTLRGNITERYLRLMESQK